MPLRIPRLPPAGIALAACLCLPAAALAATAYIIDELRVSLREAPCDQCAVVQPGLPSGLQLEVSEARDGWSRVRTAEGAEGWVPSRYLTDRPIARDQLEALRQQLAQLQEENRDLRQRLQELGAQVPGSATPDGLPPPDTPELYAQNQELLKHNKLLQSEVEVLHARLEQLEGSERQRWFFYGGVLVALGALVSVLVPRLKPKRKGYSEWR